MACTNVHVIHFKKKSTPLSVKKKKKVLHPQLKKKNNPRVKTRTPPPPPRNQMGRPLAYTFILLIT